MLVLKRVFLLLCATVSLLLFSLNFYGELTSMRVAEDIPAAKLKFANDLTLGIDDTLQQIKRREQESDLDFAHRLTFVIQNALAHIEDWETQPPDLYSQRVPAKENIWLHLVGRLSGEEQLQRYHFSDFRKTLERGIGLCGDTSTMLSDILWDNHIPNSILAFKRHVVVEVRPDNQSPYILDADYGVYFENSAGSDDIASKKALINNQYKDAGYDAATALKLSEILVEEFDLYQNTFDFMKKRYVLERLLYLLKWLAPSLLLLVAVLPYLRKRLSNKAYTNFPATYTGR